MNRLDLSQDRMVIGLGMKRDIPMGIGGWVVWVRGVGMKLTRLRLVGVGFLLMTLTFFRVNQVKRETFDLSG
jgi:hypothetical protein